MALLWFWFVPCYWAWNPASRSGQTFHHELLPDLETLFKNRTLSSVCPASVLACVEGSLLYSSLYVKYDRAVQKQLCQPVLPFSGEQRELTLKAGCQFRHKDVGLKLRTVPLHSSAIRTCSLRPALCDPRLIGRACVLVTSQLRRIFRVLKENVFCSRSSEWLE